MLSPEIIQFAVIGMVALAVGGVAYVFLYPLFSGERKTGKRLKAVAERGNTRATRAKADDVQNRRKQVQETLKDLERAQKTRKKRFSLKETIAQAGLSLSPLQFYLISAFVGGMFAFVTFNITTMPIVVGGAFVAGGLGLPRWVLTFLKKRRQNRFLLEFPNAIDIVVRGVKAGLPFNDTVRMIASESAEPVKSEFREIVEAQAVGLTIDEGLLRVYERMPLPEVNFLAIVIAIQSKAGGNLADALSNLSNVLRERKKIQGKIKAMSQEAKASAMIIAALPLVVMLLIYITTPQYISMLWTEKTGQLMLLGCAIWMGMGVLVMRKMINFDF